MRRERVRDLLARVADGSLAVDRALDSLALEPAESLGFATIDHHRALRQGFPEVVYGAGKTPDQIVAIAGRIAERGDGVLVTRLAPDAVRPLLAAIPGIEHNALAATAFLRPTSPPAVASKSVLVVTAGTSDLPVAEEAAVTADALGCRAERLTDVGVAGIHRLLARREAIEQAGVIVVVAGMDGALPSVVGGLARVPVIAVPTSVGYGAAFQGLAPLLTMLNSCAAGVTVVNIDNGFGAAVAAARILHA
ncbi:MAG: nickel pincer cofactor biosynthesis protein LarB [Gemmatimonadaceae bacterium]|nr:nickel pincer cofactor biosynthesis protein LarB [Gemmatimonadaceae bacterium]NUO93128.1 nickel pincer cofactor biosynthesis protein LarB [Gemmatimonadaceae bacterium]NUS31436.1 nickel pincer cofactor biosynthesis protein LarB [Gemmatimonadaceae bacterium]NUS47919.1 nickel pincer cofactor biosynthesis protein LarB [Gemmatimonadaceae bacterium]